MFGDPLLRLAKLGGGQRPRRVGRVDHGSRLDRDPRLAGARGVRRPVDGVHVRRVVIVGPDHQRHAPDAANGRAYRSSPAPGVGQLVAVALVSGLGAHPDRGADLAPGRAGAGGPQREPVAAADRGLVGKLGLPCLIKQPADLGGELTSRSSHPSHQPAMTEPAAGPKGPPRRRVIFMSDEGARSLRKRSGLPPCAGRHLGVDA